MNGRTNRQNVTRAETGVAGQAEKVAGADAAVDDRLPGLTLTFHISSSPIASSARRT